MLEWIGRQRQLRHVLRQEGDSIATPPASVIEVTPSDGEIPTPHLLVVDDDLFIGRLMIDTLGPYYNVEVACDATEAGHAIEKHSPDLIILDIMMPGQDGQEIGTQLRCHVRTREIPFILVSGDRRIAEKAAAAGAAAYMSKPFDIDELTALVARVLAQRESS